MSFDVVMERVSAACQRAGRSPRDVTLVAVSKSKGIEEIMGLYERGHRDFGENRAQEMEAKAAELPADIRWHYVGALQSNKVRNVRSNTFLLHSMDRRSLANAWLKGQGLPPPVLVQVNVGEESQKSGGNPDDVGDSLEWMAALGLDVRGLMAIPPIPESPEDSRSHFRQLRSLRDRLQGRFPDVGELSMGMTDDFEVAIEEGASIIRVGRAIFGPRK